MPVLLDEYENRPRKRRVILYLNNRLYENLQIAYEHLKRKGILPERGTINESRAIVLNWCVQQAVESLEAEEVD